jgi:hypothetical protein
MKTPWENLLGFLRSGYVRFGSLTLNFSPIEILGGR